MDQVLGSRSGEHEGIPLLSKVVKQSLSSKNHKVLSQITYIADKIEVGPVPESEFTPAAIGIRTPEVSAKIGYRRYFVMGGAGLLLLVMAAILILRYQKRNAV